MRLAQTLGIYSYRVMGFDGASGAEHSACWLVLEPWGTGFANAAGGHWGGSFPSSWRQLNTKVSCPRDFSALCPCSPFPHWEQQDLSMVINIQTCWCKISFTLYGVHSEKDTECLRKHTQFSYWYQYWDVNFCKKQVSNDSFLHRQRLKNHVKYQSLYSPVCANLALQGNFWHMCVTNQTHSH